MLLELKDVISDIIAREYPRSQIKDMHYVNRASNSMNIECASNQFYFGYLSIIASSNSMDAIYQSLTQILQFKDGVCTGVQCDLTSDASINHNVSFQLSTTPIIFNNIVVNEGLPVSNFVGLLVELTDLSIS
jgi:hypothetical protein